MSKLTDTTIYGDLRVNGKIKSNGDSVLLDSNFKGTTGVYYYIPVVIWHGRINCQPSPSSYIYQQAGCSISVTYVSTGTYTITMTGVNAPTTSDYQVIAIGIGCDTNTSSLASYVTCPGTYKNPGNFRLLIADDSTLNNGYCEISIIKFINIG